MAHKHATTALALAVVTVTLGGCNRVEPRPGPGPVLHTKSSLPSSHRLSVPFTSQAPHANWDDPYQEACEEAALIMVHEYISQMQNVEFKMQNDLLSPEHADAALLSLIRWQEQQGYPEDVTLQQLQQIAKDYYGYEAEIIEQPSVENLKRLIADSHPIIVPAAGRELGNPYFSGEGPWYHMLVITGYDRNEFITNDPGTRRGHGYKYKYHTLLDAIHDFTGVKEETNQGEKLVLVVRNTADGETSDSK